MNIQTSWACSCARASSTANGGVLSEFVSNECTKVLSIVFITCHIVAFKCSIVEIIVLPCITSLIEITSEEAIVLDISYTTVPNGTIVRTLDRTTVQLCASWLRGIDQVIGDISTVEDGNVTIVCT